MPTVPTAGEIIKALRPGTARVLCKLPQGGSLEVRRISSGVVFYWRFTEAGKTDRISIGAYDSMSSPKSVTPTARGYSVEAGKRAAEALAQRHREAVVAGEGGYRAVRKAETSAKAERVALEASREDAERQQSLRDAVTVGEAWASYLVARHDYWGVRHRHDHLILGKAGGEAAKRGTRGRGVTVAGPLYPLLARRLRDLDAPTIEAWAAKEAKSRPTSARLAWRCLKAFLNWCAEQPEYAPVLPGLNPARTKRTREALGKPGIKQDALMREQLPAWFEAVGNLRNATVSAYLKTVLLTGARPGEVLVMRWEDINLHWRGLTIRDKVEGERVIPLTPYVSQMLQALPRHRDDKGVPLPFVFSSPTAAGGTLSIPRNVSV